MTRSMMPRFAHYRIPRRVGRLGRLFAALAAFPASLVAQAPPSPDTPRLFIEAFRSNDRVARRAAEELRVAVQRRVPSTCLWVLTTSFIESARASGQPDDFGHTWTWDDLREVARAYRADAIIDLSVGQGADSIEIQVIRVRPIEAGAAMALPAVRAATLAGAIARLADAIARDTVLLERRSTSNAHPPNNVRCS